MMPLIRVADGLPALGELLAAYYRRSSVDHDAPDRAADARRDAPVITDLHVVPLRQRAVDWFGIDVDAEAADMECNSSASG